MARSPQAINWRVATRVITGFQTNPEAFRDIPAEPTAGGAWLRAPGCLPAGEAVGPFLKSTDAYLNASGGAVEKVSPLRIRVGLDPKAP